VSAKHSKVFREAYSSRVCGRWCVWVCKLKAMGTEGEEMDNGCSLKAKSSPLMTQTDVTITIITGRFSVTLILMQFFFMNRKR